MKFVALTVLVVLSCTLPVSWAALPNTGETQGIQPETNNGVIIDDGNSLACAGADTAVSSKVRAWMEERVAALRAKPQLSEDEKASLKAYEAYLSGPDKAITIKRLPY